MNPKAHDVADYIEGMVRALALMSRLAGFSTLTHLLEMSELEAAELVRAHDPERQAAAEN